jgi:hypothetical protein
MQPKPNPNTQARLDAADTAALAKQRADSAELTLARYHAQATAAGVQSIRFEVEPDGIVVVLRGMIERRTVSVELLAPHGQPFVLYAVAALDSFVRGQSTRTIKLTPNTPPDVPLPEPGTLADVFAKEQAAEIAKRASQVNITKPSPAGAGQRKPLSLPLCKQCEAQPVYKPGAEFCGGECAKTWHMNSASRR